MSAHVHRVAALGECMIEFSGDPLRRRYGGDTLNTALYLARLLPQAPMVRYLTALGVDDLSTELMNEWRSEGIETDRVQRLPGKLPGSYLIETDAEGERHFYYWRHDSAAHHFFAGEVEWNPLFADIDWLHLSGITLALFPVPRRRQLLDALTVFTKTGGKLSFDNNFRPALWGTEDAHPWYREVLTISEIALLTADDECAVWGESESARMIERAHDFGCIEVVLKQGAKPALASCRGERVSVAAQPVASVVDTSAAGDAFAAAYLAARWHGCGLADALNSGHRLAAVVVQHAGAIISRAAMPTEGFPFSLSGANARVTSKEFS